ncbi:MULTISPECIES: NUDIX domain-containing protein [unclassified Crossiella]|uniref:NUDIX hydrolase n=1 Tax=unclassified Crossiella TaxID=2620835 RepID=UPI001FFE3B4F|nr:MULTISPECIES: NUDIX domain-containing protein [unclassified Crossiella]MCK2237400.1 NUDIX hydrolase [Crossiella sp. S99.2]MCK2251055.1 NUDIX hydrolase [Crossiella sp. S99.1]
MNRARQTVTLTADLVILTIRDGGLSVLLVERENEPFRGRLALPGGFLRGEESLEQTATRELTEETGLDAGALRLQQVGVYSAPDRDPRRPRVVTSAYLAIAPDLPVPVAGSDARAARWVPVAEATGSELAFDHDHILVDAVDLARTLLQFSTIATAFCGPEFTIGDLREVYEIVWGVGLDKSNFHRKVTDADGFVVSTGGKRPSLTGRPAALYRAGGATELVPPMMRSRFGA